MTTKESKNKRIAIACGRTFITSDGVGRPPWSVRCGFDDTHIPNYQNGLNAVHEAEQLLIYGEWVEWLDHMGLILGLDETEGWDADSVPVLQRATSAQRAEVFLRTIGQWEDEK